MTLARRLSLMVVGIVAITAMSIAILSAFAARSSSLARVDKRIIALQNAVGETFDPVSALLKSTASTSAGFIAYFVVEDEPPIALLAQAVDTSSTEFPNLTTAQLESAQVEATTIYAVNSLRAVTLSLGDRQWLVLGEAVDVIMTDFERQLLTNLALAFGLAIIGGVMALYATRRSLRPLRRIVEYSTSVAEGQLEAKLPTDDKTIEVRQLQQSVSSMVESLRGAAETTSRSEAAMRSFLTDVAHELRTPLTTVRAYAEMLTAAGAINEETRQRARERIAHESKRMSKLIDDLLLLARIAATPLEKIERLNFAEVARSHFEDLAVLDPARSITVVTEECWMDADRALLERMLANVVNNIHRHTPANSAVLLRCTNDNEFVMCSIDDAGPGLDDQQLAQLAEGVQRFTSLRNAGHHGTGLGLHLVVSIARSHGGSVVFSRSPLGGLHVAISLPKSGKRNQETEFSTA